MSTVTIIPTHLKAPLALGLFNRVEIDRKAQFYQRLGLEPVGVWFFQEA